MSGYGHFAGSQAYAHIASAPGLLGNLYGVEFLALQPFLFLTEYPLKFINQVEQPRRVLFFSSSLREYLPRFFCCALHVLTKTTQNRNR